MYTFTTYRWFRVIGLIVLSVIPLWLWSCAGMLSPKGFERQLYTGSRSTQDLEASITFFSVLNVRVNGITLEHMKIVEKHTEWEWKYGRIHKGKIYVKPGWYAIEIQSVSYMVPCWGRCGEDRNFIGAGESIVIFPYEDSGCLCKYIRKD